MFLATALYSSWWLPIKSMLECCQFSFVTEDCVLVSQCAFRYHNKETSGTLIWLVMRFTFEKLLKKLEINNDQPKSQNYQMHPRGPPQLLTKQPDGSAIKMYQGPQRLSTLSNQYFIYSTQPSSRLWKIWWKYLLASIRILNQHVALILTSTTGVFLPCLNPSLCKADCFSGELLTQKRCALILIIKSLLGTLSQIVECKAIMRVHSALRVKINWTGGKPDATMALRQSANTPQISMSQFFMCPTFCAFSLYFNSWSGHHYNPGAIISHLKMNERSMMYSNPASIALVKVLKVMVMRICLLYSTPGHLSKANASCKFFGICA